MKKRVRSATMIPLPKTEPKCRMRSTIAIIFCLSVLAVTSNSRQLSTAPFGIYMCSGANFSAPAGSQIGPPCAWTDLRGLINQCLHLPSGTISFGPDQGLICTVVRLSRIAFLKALYADNNQQRVAPEGEDPCGGTIVGDLEYPGTPNLNRWSGNYAIDASDNAAYACVML